MVYELPKIQYGYDALEPYIDAKTMEIHHTKHHQTYVDKLNGVLEKYPDLGSMTIEELLKNLDTLKVEEADRTAIRNHGGGHFNHSLFWKVMDPEKSEPLVEFAKFQDEFTKAATGIFGSGWIWLVVDVSNTLKVITTPNQDSPLTQNLKPILGLDVWEHAYYILYKWQRGEYIKNWWNVVNWKQVEKYYQAAIK
ncbi:MAG: superoxide dismutase [bacterium]|nr:superoxide dismutase [bacterium]